MSLFPNIGVAGHGVHEGLDPNKGALQRVIANNLFQESDRGASFRRKLASVLEGVRTPVLMQAHDSSLRHALAQGSAFFSHC